jgi:hypothetical protein
MTWVMPHLDGLAKKGGERFTRDEPSMSGDVPGQTQSRHELRNLLAKNPQKAPKHLV